MKRAFWHWPGWPRLGEAVLLGLALTAWWLLIYGGANYLTGLHDFRIRVDLPFEGDIPFVPASVIGYISIYPLFWMAPFILSSRRELHALIGTLAVVTFVAGLCFVALPVANVLETPAADLGVWATPVHLAKTVAMTNNLLPSLHVGLAVVCIAVYAPHTQSLGKGMLWLWSLLIAGSTILLHQHYLIDVLSGYALALAGMRWGYRRWTSGSEN